MSPFEPLFHQNHFVMFFGDSHNCKSHLKQMVAGNQLTFLNYNILVRGSYPPLHDFPACHQDPIHSSYFDTSYTQCLSKHSVFLLRHQYCSLHTWLLWRDIVQLPPSIFRGGETSLAKCQPVQNFQTRTYRNIWHFFLVSC